MRDSPLAIGRTHVLRWYARILEARVNASVLDQYPLSGQEIAFALVSYQEERVQELVVKAYEATYSGRMDCKGRPIFKHLTKEIVADAGQSALSWNLLAIGSSAFPHRG